MPLQWLRHDGIQRPVAISKKVHIRVASEDSFLHGAARQPRRADAYMWEWRAHRSTPRNSDITHYAIALPDATPPPPTPGPWMIFRAGDPMPVLPGTLVQIATTGQDTPTALAAKSNNPRDFEDARRFAWSADFNPSLHIVAYRVLPNSSAETATLTPSRPTSSGLTPEQKAIKDALPTWARAQYARHCTGHYSLPPWHAESWAQHPPTDPRFLHFLHYSQTQSGLLAYTPQAPAEGAKPLTIPIKPGRYLQRFYSDVLDPGQIKEQAAKVRGHTTTLHITTDASAIVEIYKTIGQACMSHTAGHYRAAHYNGGKHPASFYASSPDLALAYITATEGGKILARAVVWPSRKLYARCYGDTDAMIEALANDGYHSAPLDGARLPLVTLTGELASTPPRYFNCPYIDHIKWARADTTTRHLILQERATGATHSVQHGDGIAYPIAEAPPRPVRTSHETIAQEHARLSAIESGQPAPDPSPQSEAPSPPPRSIRENYFRNIMPSAVSRPMPDGVSLQAAAHPSPARTEMSIEELARALTTD